MKTKRKIKEPVVLMTVEVHPDRVVVRICKGERCVLHTMIRRRHGWKGTEKANVTEVALMSLLPELDDYSAEEILSNLSRCGESLHEQLCLDEE